MGIFDFFKPKRKNSYVLKKVSNSVSEIDASKVSNLSEIIVFRTAEDGMLAKDMQFYNLWMEGCLGEYWPIENSVRARYHSSMQCGSSRYRQDKIESILTDDQYPQQQIENIENFLVEHIGYVFNKSIDVDSCMYAFFKIK